MNPELLKCIPLVYSEVATSLARMSQAVRLYGTITSSSDASCSRSRSRSMHTSTPPTTAGRTSPQRQAERTELSNVKDESDKHPQHHHQQQDDLQQGASQEVLQTADAEGGQGCSKTASVQHCWQQMKADLMVLMQEECEGHWRDVMAAAADSPIILPSLTGVRARLAL